MMLISKEIKELANLSLLSSLISFFNFFHLFFLANILGAESYGIFSIIVVQSTIMLQFILWGINENGIKLMSDNINENDIATTRLINFGIFTIFFIFYSLYFEKDYFYLIILNSISGFGLSIIYEYNKKNVNYLIIFFFQRLLSFTTIWIVFFVYKNISIFQIIVIMFIYDFLSFVFQIYDREIHVKFNYNNYKKIIKSGSTILLFIFSKMCFGSGLKLFVFEKYGNLQAGVLALSWQLITLSSIIFTQLTKVYRLTLNESVSKRNYTIFKSTIFKMLTISFSISIFIIIIVYFLSEYFEIYFLDESFEGIHIILIVLSFYIPVISLEFVIIQVAIALNISNILKNTYVSLGFLISLVYFSIWHFGLEIEFKNSILILVLINFLALLINSIIIINKVKDTEWIY